MDAPRLGELVLRPILAADPRVEERADGLWAAAESPAPREPEGYTVIEAASGPGGPDVAAAAIRVSETGERGEAVSVFIRPARPWREEALPPAVRGHLADAPGLDDAASQVAAFAAGTTLVSFAPSRLLLAVGRALSERGQAAPGLSLRRLARSVLGKDAARSRADMAQSLGLTVWDIETPAQAAASTAEALGAFIEREGALEGRSSLALLSRQEAPRIGPDFDSFAFTREDVAALSTGPGVYIMRDAGGAAVYVGKAMNLRRRVGGYFQSRIEEDERVDVIVGQTRALETRAAGSELEALLMEYRAIRELQPRLNQQVDVGERGSSQRERPRRVVTVLPSVRPRCAELFLVRGAEALAQARYSRRWSARAREAMGGFFFREPPEAGGDQAEARIFWTWWARRRDEARTVDVAMAGGPDDAARLVFELAEDTLSGEDMAFRV